uniref:Uncharacterized protein n=1 Tax=Cacopsylla melanoneura TaxID=428564 RepID=A0A8D8VKC4_9HEMI
MLPLRSIFESEYNKLEQVIRNASFERVRQKLYAYRNVEIHHNFFSIYCKKIIIPTFHLPLRPIPHIISLLPIHPTHNFLDIGLKFKSFKIGCAEVIIIIIFFEKIKFPLRKTYNVGDKLVLSFSDLIFCHFSSSSPSSFLFHFFLLSLLSLSLR